MNQFLPNPPMPAPASPTSPTSPSVVSYSLLTSFSSAHRHRHSHSQSHPHLTPFHPILHPTIPLLTSERQHHLIRRRRSHPQATPASSHIDPPPPFGRGSLHMLLSAAIDQKGIVTVHCRLAAAAICNLPASCRNYYCTAPVLPPHPHATPPPPCRDQIEILSFTGPGLSTSSLRDELELPQAPNSVSVANPPSKPPLVPFQRLASHAHTSRPFFFGGGGEGLAPQGASTRATGNGRFVLGLCRL
ncbi:hypothetical protein CDEST_11384 [Colletotrichum destructivum]|uniref:Uncharacterized protein n=1 Tax=Colletotrichum destructivum TaxID=34406 RepID=A0AAX4IT64_9PEZI|nr:hypothetical protein CDEST_11384 [Colletotrichum destructivum]